MIGIFISARLGSTRLAQKHLIKANGKSFIEWLAGRYLQAFKNELESNQVKIFITTSVKEENKKFENIFTDTAVNVFYGNDGNIPLRHLECAVENNIKFIISIDGDDVLCSTSAAKIVIDSLMDNSMMASTSGLPLGMNVSGYRVDFLQSSLEKTTSTKLETGWGKIFNQDLIKMIYLDGYELGKDIRMTLDYKDDAVFFEKVITTLGDKVLQINDKDLIDIILENKFNIINESLNEQYWLSFNAQKQLEG